MAQLAACLGALGAVLVLVPRQREATLAGIGLTAIAIALLQASDGHLSTGRLVVGVAGLVPLAVVAVVFVRRPAFVPPAVLLAAPFRMPIDVHGSHISLAHGGQVGRLLPLYGVLAAAALALAWRIVRNAEARPIARELAVPVAAFVAFACVSELWTSATGPARNLLEYFLLPFALLVAVVARSPFPAWAPRTLAVSGIALASLFAGIGLVEEATHRLIYYTPSVEVGNAYSSFFRVTSLFRDPSLYGRQVVLGIAVVLVLAWYRRIGLALGGALVAALYAGLFFSYSQSSFAALFAVALFTVAVAGDHRVRIGAVAITVVVAAVGTVYGVHKLSTSSTQRVTSDRSRRIALTARVFAHHPLVGVGIGSQPRASQGISAEGGAPTLFVSHTTPLTVAAELGVVGLALYALLLAGAGSALARVRRLDPVLGVLAAAAAIETPLLGSDPWPFRPKAVTPHGVLAPLVRAAHRHWDLGVVRTPAVLALALVALAAVVGWQARSWSRGWLAALCVAVVGLLTVPAVLLQVGLRDATAPWFHTNDSTYQIELAGKLVLHGHTPYGHDYTGSGLERFYSRDGTVPPPEAHRQVALTHFAYFPGAALTAAAWRALPAPFDDYRVLVLLTTIGILFAALAFRGPPAWRLGIGSALAASPPLVRGAWFGTADAPSLLCLVLAFGLLTRRRPVLASGLLAAAVLQKQFALVAIPFFALMLLARESYRPTRVKAAGVFLAIVAVGFLPFLIADPGALWRDTIDYGASTYRILGYGLSALLYNAHVIHSRYGSYPFGILVLVVWLPVTLWLLAAQRRSRVEWEGAAGFAVSMFVLLFVARTFQTSYLVWPLTGIAVAALLAVGRQRETSP